MLCKCERVQLLPHSTASEIGPMSKATYLSAQLRESVPYLQDAGWRQTADLLLAAADEIETLRAQLAAQAEQATESADDVARAKATSRRRA